MHPGKILTRSPDPPGYAISLGSGLRIIRKIDPPKIFKNFSKYQPRCPNFRDLCFWVPLKVLYRSPKTAKDGISSFSKNRISSGSGRIFSKFQKITSPQKKVVLTRGLHWWIEERFRSFFRQKLFGKKRNADQGDRKSRNPSRSEPLSPKLTPVTWGILIAHFIGPRTTNEMSH